MLCIIVYICTVGLDDRSVPSYITVEWWYRLFASSYCLLMTPLKQDVSGVATWRGLEALQVSSREKLRALSRTVDEILKGSEI